MAVEDADVELTREDEDDHDLLTYGEAGVRLQQEVRRQRDVVEGLRSEGGEGFAKASARLRDLEEAFERNRRQPINDDNFERFFGYAGVARRNT